MVQGKSKMGVRIAAVAAACVSALPQAVPGAEAEAKPTHACSLVRDRSERLDCYDAAFGKPTGEADARLEAAAPATAEANFGLTLEQIERRAPGGGAAKSDRIASAVVALKRDRDGRFTVTLENGQVWVQSEIQSGATLAIGDPVTIRSAAMGSYLLVTPRGVATRVRRLD
jgi:hypothetical protein